MGSNSGRLPREAGDSELSLSQQNRTQSRGRSNTGRVELGLMRAGLGSQDAVARGRTIPGKTGRRWGQAGSRW